MNLYWSLSDKKTEMEVPVDVNLFADIVHTSNINPSVLTFEVPNYAQRLADIWKNKGVFELEVWAHAANALPAGKIIKFKWDGQWSGLSYIGSENIRSDRSFCRYMGVHTRS